MLTANVFPNSSGSFIVIKFYNNPLATVNVEDPEINRFAALQLFKTTPKIFKFTGEVKNYVKTLLN
jgi:hypothetical protein